MDDIDFSIPPSSNPKGESVPLSARVPPESMRAIRLIVESPETAWETPSDVVRAAIHAFIQDVRSELNVGGSLLPPLLGLLKRWEVQTTRSAMHDSLAQSIGDVGDQLRVYLESGDKDRLAAELEDVCEDLMGLRDAFWLKRCLSRLFDLHVTQDCLRTLGDDIGPQTESALATWKELNEEER